MRTLPIMTGLLTIALMGFIGVSLLGSGMSLWGWLLIGLAALRAVLLAGQVWRIRQRDAQDAQQDPEP